MNHQDEQCEKYSKGNTLVLGHSKYYNINDIRCSPIPLSQWIYDEYITVDIDKNIKPDIVYNLKNIPWIFAEDNSFDRIIDATGIEINTLCSKIDVENLYKFEKSDIGKVYYSYSPEMKNEILRVLKKNGTFYGRNFIMTKN
jgi:hypothetical protein